MRHKVFVAVAGVALLAVALAGVAWLDLQRHLEPAAPEGPQQIFVVERGQGLAQIAHALERAGLVRDARAAILAGRWHELAGKLHAGEYELSPAQPALALLEQIAEGHVKTWPVVIPEGLRASEIAERLEQAGIVEAEPFLAYAMSAEAAAELSVEGTSLEGYLYPDTYNMAHGLGAKEVASVLVAQFAHVWREIEPLARERGLSMRETVTLASIVEKETAVADERPRIAGVFLNRLERGMRLESDPTTIYGIPDFDGNLRRVHLEDASNPYNTYRIPGLPPGPIASPGRDALMAVVRPEEHEFLYFVARGDGTHHFSKTYREHTNAVLRYQLGRRQP